MEFEQRQHHTALYFCIFVEFLVSMQLWIGWMRRSIIIYLFFAFIMGILILQQKIRLDFCRRNVISALFFVVAYFLHIGELGIINALGFGFSTFIIILLNEEDRVECWNYIFKWFAYLMIPSIILFILYRTVGLPSLGTIRFSNSADISTDYLIRNNFIFYNTPVNVSLEGWNRFNGPFNEPGHLGMMTAFMLLVDGYDLKKKTTWIMILSLLLTMSLAGYVLGVIGYLFARYELGKFKLKYLFTISFLIAIIFMFGTYYRGGDNIVNELLVSRFEYDENTGIVGNHRASTRYYLIFSSMAYDRELLLNGVGADTVAELHSAGHAGTGYVAWMVEFGLIGLIQAFLFYIVYLLFNDNKKDTFLLLLFVALMFMQRSYPYWFAWVICYTYGISLRDYRKRIKTNIIKKNERTIQV